MTWQRVLLTPIFLLSLLMVGCDDDTPIRLSGRVALPDPLVQPAVYAPKYRSSYSYADAYRRQSHHYLQYYYRYPTGRLRKYPYQLCRGRDCECFFSHYASRRVQPFINLNLRFRRARVFTCPGRIGVSLGDYYYSVAEEADAVDELEYFGRNDFEDATFSVEPDPDGVYDPAAFEVTCDVDDAKLHEQAARATHSLVDATRLSITDRGDELQLKVGGDEQMIFSGVMTDETNFRFAGEEAANENVVRTAVVEGTFENNRRGATAVFVSGVKVDSEETQGSCVTAYAAKLTKLD